MRGGPPDPDDAALAVTLARRAGALLLERRSRGDLAGADLRAAGDREANRLLLDALAAARPGDAVLSEEAADDPRRLDSPRVWIIDPLDGTREYGEGRDDWAVHVALWQAGRLATGAVALPARGEVLSSHPGEIVPDAPDGPVRIAVSRSRPPSLVGALVHRLDAQVVAMGSAGVKVAAVVQGAADVYVHAGGQYEWDSAAPVAVALGGGLHASRIDGSPLVYNRPDPLLPDLLVCRPELADRLLAAIAGIADEVGSRPDH